MRTPSLMLMSALFAISPYAISPHPNRSHTNPAHANLAESQHCGAPTSNPSSDNTDQNAFLQPLLPAAANEKTPWLVLTSGIDTNLRGIRANFARSLNESGHLRGRPRRHGRVRPLV